MNSLFVEHVRCFHERQGAALRPVTVLIGENSSGKSTFLGLVRVAWNIGALRWNQAQEVDFNADPFAFGSYDQIATFRGGRGGLARAFTIAAQFAQPSARAGAGGGAAWVTGTFVDERGQPVLSQWSLRADHYSAVIYPREKRLRVEVPDGPFEVSGAPAGVLLATLTVPQLVQDLGLKSQGNVPARVSNAQARLSRSMRMAFASEPYAFAPIRTKPMRTYDPITDEARPEGSHVPVVLARMVGGDPAAWNVLRAGLEEFGRESGLFDVVDVRRMGRKDSDPFQIRIKITGPAFNLVDVGYGVSQVLPILVDCSRDKRPRTFLLQQPEVHLHPRAQAALGSWLGALAKAQNKRFVIETHSDHLIDRLRMDVRDGRHLKPSDVSILYFERRRGATTIHHLDLDERGNFRRVPASYRSFFLDEERRMLAG